MIKKIIKVIRFSRKAFGNYKRAVGTLVILGLLSGLFEAIGVNTLIPLFSIIAGQGHVDDTITRFILNGFEYFDIDFRIRYLLIFMLILFTLKAISTFFAMLIRARIMSDYEYKERTSLFTQFVSADWKYLSQQKVGHLENVLMNDVRWSAILLREVSQGLAGIATLTVYVFAAISISKEATLLTLFVGGILFFVFRPLFVRVRYAARKTSEKNKGVAHFVNEHILGLKAVKSAPHSISPIVKIGNDYFKKLKELRIRLLVMKGLSSIFIEPIALMFIVVLFAVTYTTNSFDIASFVVVIYLIQRIFTYVNQLQSNISRGSEAIPYLEHVLRYKEETSAYRENVKQKKEFAFTQSLTFKDVSFKYGEDSEVLKNISFDVQKGEMFGIVGPSGGGKTTIVDLVLRLHAPTSGPILLDGEDVSHINLFSWRKHIGYVSQDTFLLNDTVENNIRFYDDTLSQDEIVQAAEEAQIHEFIMSLPEGYQTPIGERGTRLSGGQRQRVLIARALVQKPDILILDEATSALDTESEQRIQEVIERLKGKTTILVIAHRLSTVRSCNRLLVLEDGRIAEIGDPSDLLKDKESKFFKAYNIQQ